MCDSTFLGAILLYFTRTLRASVVSSLVRTWWYQGHETLRDPSGTGRSSIFAIATKVCSPSFSPGRTQSFLATIPQCNLRFLHGGFVYRERKLRRSVTGAKMVVVMELHGGLTAWQHLSPTRNANILRHPRTSEGDTGRSSLNVQQKRRSLDQLA